MKWKHPKLSLLGATLACFAVGFVCWMIGNPDFKVKARDYRDWFDLAGSIWILLGDVGLIAAMVWFSRGWSRLKRIGAFIATAALLSALSVAIVFLEYGVLNFGDSDLPPYEPDTPFERAFDFVLCAVGWGAALLWLFVLFFGLVLLYQNDRQPVA